MGSVALQLPGSPCLPHWGACQSLGGEKRGQICSEDWSMFSMPSRTQTVFSPGALRKKLGSMSDLVPTSPQGSRIQVSSELLDTALLHSSFLPLLNREMDKQLDNGLVTLYETCMTEQSPTWGSATNLWHVDARTPPLLF